LQHDFEAFAQVTELDSNLMHAVMMTSQPSLLYWQPATLAVMQAVQDTRQKGLPVCYTIDAGPNVHVLSESVHTSQVLDMLGSIRGVEQLITARPGGPARLL
jgi:diphosphomevalonate decarboxylase